MKRQKTNERGFTIIEVVLVLAIAALIFLVVFLAVPALQGSQRDTQRRQDVARLLTQLNNYAGNNQGQMPTAAVLTDPSSAGFLAQYMRPNSEQFADPVGGQYTMVALTGTALPSYDTTTAANIYFEFNVKCAAGSLTSTGNTSNRTVSLIKPLERGGAECVNN